MQALPNSLHTVSRKQKTDIAKQVPLALLPLLLYFMICMKQIFITIFSRPPAIASGTY